MCLVVVDSLLFVDVSGSVRSIVVEDNVEVESVTVCVSH